MIHVHVVVGKSTKNVVENNIIQQRQGSYKSRDL